MLRLVLLLFLALSALTLGTSESHSYLPPCSATSGPCKCPHGVTFKNLTSYSIIGAPAIEVQKIMDNCGHWHKSSIFQHLGSLQTVFESEWQGGVNPYKTTGAANAVGATRTYNYTLPNGYFIFEETVSRIDHPVGIGNLAHQQTAQSKSADGSFVFGFAQSPEPKVVTVPGAGEFHGEWSIILAEQTVVANETAISWNNWRCDVGTPYDAPGGHESALANVSSILRANGKLTGVDVAPFTIVYTVRDD